VEQQTTLLPSKGRYRLVMHSTPTPALWPTQGAKVYGFCKQACLPYKQGRRPLLLEIMNAEWRQQQLLATADAEVGPPCTGTRPTHPCLCAAPCRHVLPNRPPLQALECRLQRVLFKAGLRDSQGAGLVELHDFLVGPAA
jgi:hypothetical protein